MAKKIAVFRQEDIINLHEMWSGQQKKCTKAKHKDQKQLVLNYAHVQVVYLCPKCYQEGTEKHNKYLEEHSLL